MTQRTHSEFLREILPRFVRPSLYEYYEDVSRGLVPERSYSYPWKYNPYIPAPNEDGSDPRPNFLQEAFSDDLDWRLEEREVEMEFRDVDWNPSRMSPRRESSGKGAEERKVSTAVGPTLMVRTTAQKGGIAKSRAKGVGGKGKGKVGQKRRRKLSYGSRAWR